MPRVGRKALLLDRERAIEEVLRLFVVRGVEVLGQVLDRGQPRVALGLPLPCF